MTKTIKTTDGHEFIVESVDWEGREGEHGPDKSPDRVFMTFPETESAWLSRKQALKLAESILKILRKADP